MEARIHRPLMGVAALCATLVCLSANVASAQYGRPAVYGAQSGINGVGRPPMRGGAMPGAGPATGQPGAGQSENFIVLCNDPNLTQTVSQAAEKLRRDLAVHWLGEELPNWSRRCPIHVTSGANLGAGGETRFSLYNGNVGEWNMSVQGTPERILDSVLPHEITHTIFASHFAPLNVHVPRWADEGACTTVEHSSEQDKHKSHLLQYLSTGRGLSFNRMFSLKDYPKDILPLYAQGHSVVEFLIAQGGPRKFVQFLEEGMQSQRWEPAIQHAYEYETLGQLQTKWNQWIAEGRGPVDRYVANPNAAGAGAALATNSQPATVPSLDAKPLESESDLLLEGASVALVSLAAPIDESAITKISSNGQSLTLNAPNSIAAVANTTPANAVAANAAGANASNVSTPHGDLAVSDAGFYRQRLESKLRDIVRVPPAGGAPTGATPAAQEAPADRLASLDRASLDRASSNGLANESPAQRSTSRPQPAQPTPLRVLDAGNSLPPTSQQPIYR